MKQSTPVITTNNLVKKFGSFKALDGLDLSVERGEVHGFLGPNGAGKSTTIRILLGLMKRTEGNATVLGKDPWTHAVELHKKLAYVPGDVNLWPGLSGGEVIDLLGELRGGLNKKKRAELLERFQLDPRKKFRTYSKGNRQKVALVAALASDVDLYLFDEPTSGFDPLMEAVFQEYVGELKAKGKTILLSSHILAEVEALCDRITVIKDGKRVESGTLSELRHLHRTTIRVETDKKISGLKSIKGLHDLKVDGNRAEFQVDSTDLDAALDVLAKHKVTSLTSHPPTLEELFMRHYNDVGNK